MLEKSIIDASDPLRTILREYDIVNYDNLPQVTEYKILKDSHVCLNSNIVNMKTSFYRPTTKHGDREFGHTVLKKIYFIRMILRLIASQKCWLSDNQHFYMW